MINRVLIRIKVLQMVYAYYQKEPIELKAAENELLLSLRMSYDLYNYFLLLIVELTRAYELLVDSRRNKYRPSDEELNPDMRLLNNRFARQVEENETLQAYVKEHCLTWIDDKSFVKDVLDMILKSDVYSNYLRQEEDTYDTDRDFWRIVFKRIISDNEDIDAYLEDKSIYWNEDIDIIESFVIKTIKRFEQENGSKQELIQMYNSNEDFEFALNLFRNSILHAAEYRERIFNLTKNWDSERIASMDIVIMQTALAELLGFPSIPIKVTLDEYIDAAKYYSTPKSSIFINGILDAIVNELKDEKLLMKE
ncbi:MAG: transcription antitermination factor NusB [Tannerella sp.]|nr:transcription antitermination factor NusB [Tannerella sp.]